MFCSNKVYPLKMESKNGNDFSITSSTFSKAASIHRKDIKKWKHLLLPGNSNFPLVDFYLFLGLNKNFWGKISWYQNISFAYSENSVSNDSRIGNQTTKTTCPAEVANESKLNFCLEVYLKICASFSTLFNRYLCHFYSLAVEL